MTSLRGRARRLLRRALSPAAVDALRVLAAAASLTRHVMSARPRGLVLLYHRIEAQPGDPARELVPAVGVASFRRQLRWMSRLFRIVPAADILVETLRRGRGDRVPIAITFDDEWPTHASLAVPELRAAGVRATFFLTGAHCDGPAPFWWESLQHAVDRGLPVGHIVGDGTIFEQALRVTEADAATRAGMSAGLRSIAGAGVRTGVAEGEVRLLGREQDVGFHTLRHDTLTALSDDELAAALRDGRAELEELIGARLELIAYPHGSAGEREARAAREAGFSLGFTAEAEACGPWSDPLLLGRVEPGDVPLGVFLSILTGRLDEARRFSS